jgi:1-deoxy-D-xylulose-5-phosphate reductoisomerase
MMGLRPTTMDQGGKRRRAGNKETLVAAERSHECGKESKTLLLPVAANTAHISGFAGNRHGDINRIILTASGGPFRGFSKEALQKVTLAQALNHPNWKMGSKITIDSATMMNKGLEVIEARWLFDVPPEKIEVVVHPQSVVHSMVEYIDHSIIAQLGIPDMRVPISYALTYPERIGNRLEGVDFVKLGTLTFEKPDLDTFRCLGLAYEAIKAGGSYPVVLNAANEVLVQKFLEGRIGFLDIQETIERVMNEHRPVYNLDLEGIIETDHTVRGDLIG